MDVQQHNNQLRLLVNRSYSRIRYLQKYNEYIERLDAQGLPAIFSFGHLADIFGIERRRLYSICFATEFFYRDFSVKKKNGGLRSISSPMPDLYFIQRWISKFIVSKLPVDVPSVMAYRTGSSILNHAQMHCSQPYLLRLDIKDFFPSISMSWIFNLFSTLGYSNIVSKILTHLVTRNDGLPQGAPSSPAICNAIMYPIDTAIREYCVKNGIIYSRYADDLVFSGDISVNDYDYFCAVVSTYGLKINKMKTRIYGPSESSRLVTGLVISGSSVRVPKKNRRKIRQDVYLLIRSIESMDANRLREGFSRTSGLNEDPFFFDKVIGRLHFWKWVEPSCEFPVTALRKLREIETRVLNDDMHPVVTPLIQP